MAFSKPTTPPPVADGEMALLLDTGQLVAISVVPSWLPNGAGVSFACAVRHIAADGTPVLSTQGPPVRVDFYHTADTLSTGTADAVTAITKELLLALLGEPPTLDSNGYPLLPLSDEVRANVSIRKQIATAEATAPSAVNPATVLGL